MRYADMPIPPRRAGAPGPGVPGKPVPAGFACALTLTGERLTFTASLVGHDAVYRGRGYFTESPADPAGAGFRVAQLSLLDPFLWQYRTVDARHFQIVLRVIVPKLQRDGVPLTCALTMTDEAPLQLDVTETAGGFRCRLTCAVPRTSLSALRGLDGFMLAESTLYRIRPEQLQVFAAFPDGEFELSVRDAADLGHLCSLAPQLFSGSGVFALANLSRGADPHARQSALRDPVLSRMVSASRPADTARTVHPPVQADLGPRPLQSAFGQTAIPGSSAAAGRTAPVGQPRQTSIPGTDAYRSWLREKAEAVMQAADETLARRMADRSAAEVVREAVLPARPAAPRREIPLVGPALIRAAVLPSPRFGSVRSAVFLSDARRLRDYTVAHASFTGFRVGRPTYADMDPAQRAWYFYWRAQFRRGVLLPTDISYIYVAAYELLNSITAAGAEALSTLLRLWEGYRAAFPYLDRCMPGWCADFMLVHDLGTDFDALSERIPFAVDAADLPPELFCGRRLRDGLHTLPPALLGALSGYAVTQSRFCADETRTALLSDAIRRGLEAVEAAALQANGKPLLETLAPTQTISLHDCFYGAVTGRAASARVELTWRPYAHDERFRGLLSALLRAVENRLRQQTRFPGRLKVPPLPAWAEAALNAALSASPAAAPETERSHEPIVIDLDRARALEDASWENTRRLLDALGDAASKAEPETVADPLPAGPVPAAEAAPEPAVAPSAGSFAASEPVCEPSPEPTEELPFRARLSVLQRQVLDALLAEDRAAASRICAEAMTFPEAVFEEINEIALEALGDILIGADGAVFEEYRSLVGEP